jgi:hypothetical protein
MRFFTLFLFWRLSIAASQKRSVWSWKNGDIPTGRTTSPLTPSACGNGGFASTYAYACPHQAMLTRDMQLAADFDNLSNNFVYALAGSGTDQECGKCYQVQLLDAERMWRDDLPQLVVQIINSGFDVMPGQMDLFMGAGGFGYFTACNRDCDAHHCQGGACASGMYSGDFRAWTDAQFPDPNQCYAGGIKWLNESKAETLCLKLSDGDTMLKDVALHDSCILTNRLLFHQNFVSTKYTRVRCPEGLYRLSGLRREDNDLWKPPLAENVLDNSCQGSRADGHYCITTMQDCCVPSCSWDGKVDSSPGFNRVDRCFANGSIVV